MLAKPSILAFAASVRSGSYNGRLVNVAADGARAAGADVTVLDLAAYPLPLYDAPVETAAQVPAPVRALAREIAAHRGLIVASPEYNAAVPPILVNMLAWLARPSLEEQPDVFLVGKVAAIVSASPEALGGLRGLSQLAGMLGTLGVLVQPFPLGIGGAKSVFDASGALVDKALDAKVRGVGAALVQLLTRLEP